MKIRSMYSRVYPTQLLNIQTLMLSLNFIHLRLKEVNASLCILRSSKVQVKNLDSIFKSDKGPYSQSYGCSHGHVWMWESDHKEGWVPKNWYFRMVGLEKTLESPLDSKEIKPVNPKGNQPWIFIGRTDTEAETPIFWPPDTKSQLIGKDPDAGKDFRQEEKGMTEDELIGWHHRLNGQGGMVCCSQWGHKESHMTERLNNSNKKYQGWYETLI